MNGEVAGLLAPFARDGQHDATCTYGCFADHGTLDDLLATVEWIVATAKAEAACAGYDEARHDIKTALCEGEFFDAIDRLDEAGFWLLADAPQRDIESAMSDRMKAGIEQHKPCAPLSLPSGEQEGE